MNQGHRHNRDRRTHDGPPVQNDRFASLSDDRPRPTEPLPTNSRFAAAAADYDKERNERRDKEREFAPRGPPPRASGRFAAAAADYEKERELRDMARAERAPPQPTNSRFASAAADYEREREDRRSDRNNEPLQTNSRFAGMEYDRDKNDRFERRRDDDNGGGFGGGGRFNRDSGPPPVPTNSRFAAAMDSDPDYVPADVRQQRERERMEQGGDSRGERGGSDRFGREEGRGDHNRGFGRDNRGNRDRNRNLDDIQLPSGPSWKRDVSLTPDELPTNKGNVSNILAPKKREEDTVLPPVEAPLTLPGEDEEAAKARLEKARLEKEAKAAKEQAEKEEREAKEKALKEEAERKAKEAAEAEATLLDEFISEKKLGKDLEQWCHDQGAVLPSVEKLVYHLLTNKEGSSPDPECPWAAPEKYGSALLSLVTDKGYEQIQVLWAIQKYCDSISFPKYKDEYVVQSMFRAMYKYDIAEPGAFDEWKEDESEENSRGKMKAVIQTMDWFAWLEEDDDESSEEEEYEEE